MVSRQSKYSFHLNFNFSVLEILFSDRSLVRVLKILKNIKSVFEVINYLKVLLSFEK